MEVKFLDYLITAKEILPDEKKIQAVRDYPVPKNLRELRGFLGLASYYRKFIEKFSSIAKPMNQLLKKDKDYQWNDACQNSFEILKDRLIKALILRYPDFTKPFYIETDASGTGLGAVLA